MIEVQCTSCHTRYRVDEQVLPEGTPTFKCSRCGHVFSVEPRRAEAAERRTDEPPAPRQPAFVRPAVKRDAAPLTDEDVPRSPTPSSEAAPTAAQSASLTGAEPPLSEQPPTPSQPESQAPRSVERKRPPTDELLSRSFSTDPPPNSESEDLQFDFDDEPPHLGDLEEVTTNDPEPPSPPKRPMPPQRPSTKRKTVYSVEAQEPLAPADRFEIGDPDLLQPPRRSDRRKPPNDEFVDESEAPVYNSSATHSARFFLAMVMLVGLGFALMTLMIHSAPARARDLLNHLPEIGDRFASSMTLSQTIVLRDVHSKYEAGRNGHAALVIQGEAENVGSRTLHTIRITARMSGPTPGSNVARDVYCGNTLGQQTIAQMTPHEVEFFQQLQPPKGFTLASSASCPFVVVFLDPPPARYVALSVTEASPPRPETDNPPES